ncbi:hypothetical protein EVG20_g1169 [Dentipellis fragilis]|uniref:Rsm22-domain-containing protein n=1 Tax=Dentipellis fragilis TaxID=205917 RepID=A0A4Y9ZDD4_9AGAM|nr:hypothetical protein EVG20_g1169 [Dentipellis fragilis]
MLWARCHTSVRAIRHLQSASLSSSARSSSYHPNAPLDLDPSFKALLKDVDTSLLQHKTRRDLAGNEQASFRELEVFQELEAEAEIYSYEEMDAEPKGTRKSPAAHFGSQKTGAVVLPYELQQSIEGLIAGLSDKRRLHNDARRLFQHEDSSATQWDPTYDADYKSRKQSHRHAERDGTAFASVALPAHYSAIYAVIDHVKQRLGLSWNVQTVLDWGAGTGSGLWAVSNVLRERVAREQTSNEEARLAESTISNYVAIERREGLAVIGKRLIEGADLGNLTVSWRKSHTTDLDSTTVEGASTLALSAFHITAIPTPVQRKALVKEMWESGADVIIIMDHNTPAGFGNIVEAREYLLKLGRKEAQDQGNDLQAEGAYVVAPCPHDGACPIYHSDARNVVCGFSQRLQRPAFVRKTKHSGRGHEDIGYSYVVIRRGARPTKPSTEIGRMGEVGLREAIKAQAKQELTELELHDEQAEQSFNSTEEQPTTDSDYSISNGGTEAELEEGLRMEAFHWPRLVLPPLKRSGHIILDACTSEGRVMRLTVPKSQGKQPYYDARKSEWGDLFPHPPKNAPQVRFEPVLLKREGSTKPSKTMRGGKADPKTSYTHLTNELKKEKDQLRRQRRREALE